MSDGKTDPTSTVMSIDEDCIPVDAEWGPRSSTHGKDVEVSIVGQGMMGSALAAKLKSLGHMTKVFGRDFDPAQVLECKLVLLAVPVDQVASVAQQLASVKTTQQNIIVEMSNVDISKSSSIQQLQDLNPRLRVVKAFNSISAFDIANSTAREMLIAGDSEAANRHVAEIAVNMGFAPQIVGPLNMATHAESKPLGMFTGYRQAFALVMSIWLFTFIYACLRYLEDGASVGGGKYPWDMAPLYIFNKTVCWTGLWALGFTYVLGGIAELKSKPLPPLLINLLAIRKHMGLIAYGMICLHVIISLLIFGPAYYGKFYDEFRGKLKGEIEVSMLLGIFGFLLVSFTAISSVPSIGSHMSWKEWVFLQRWLGLAALFLGTAHVVVMGNKGWSDPKKGLGKYTGHKGMPSITFVSTVPCMAVIVFRIIVHMLPSRFKPAPRAIQMPSWFRRY